MFARSIIAALIAAIAALGNRGFAQQQIEAENYAVVSGHPEATAAGMQILRDGGNVIDAAIATSLALGVAEPYGSGLGGKLVMLYRDAATGEMHSIVALCTAPAALDAEQFAKLPRSERSYGYKAVGVPGLVAGLGEAHKRWGQKAWAELCEPAVALAERGVAIDATMRGMFAPKVKTLRQDSETAELYLVNNEAPPIGAVMKNADLASSLREIAIGGASAFYNGPLAERIVAASRNGDGWLQLDDFRNYRAEIGKPLEIDYRGHRVYSCPPPLTGGVTVLAALECLESMAASNAPCANTEVAFTDRACRALQCLYPRIRDSIADVPTAASSAKQYLDAATATKLANAATTLDPRNPQQDVKRRPKNETTSEALPAASTSHLVVVDREGNMVSLTQSLSLHFGASVVPPGTGILLNDSMSNFATHSSRAVNHVAAGKRARSTIAPMIVTKAGRPWLALGIPGGQRIPTTTLQLLWRLIDRQQPLADVFAASRFHLLRPLRADAPENVLEYEQDAAANWVQELSSLGWNLKPRRRNGHYFGGGGAAQYTPSGRIIGVADPRRTNFAAGD